MKPDNTIWKDAKTGLDWWRRYFEWIDAHWLKGEQKRGTKEGE